MHKKTLSSADRVDVEAAIRTLARRQHGVVTRRQLLEAGVAPHRISYRLKQGRLTVVRRGIYREGAVPSSREGEMVALLACGQTAVLSLHTAAAAWGLSEEPGPRSNAPPSGASSTGSRRGPGSTEPRRRLRPAPSQHGGRTGIPVHVSIRSGHARSGESMHVHRVAELREDEVTTLDGLPVTTPARTLLDLAPVVTRRELEQMLADGLRKGIVTEKAMTLLLHRYPRRPGAARLRALLTSEDPPAFLRSRAEEVLYALLARAGRRPPRTNVNVLGYEVDVYWPRQKLIVEVDGRAAHSGRRAFEGDRRRDTALQAKGYRVIRVTWERLSAEPEAVLADIVEALATPAGQR